MKAYEKKNPNYLAETLAYELDISLHMLCQKYGEYLGAFMLEEELALDSGKLKVLDRILPEIIEQKVGNYFRKLFKLKLLFKFK